MFAAAEKIMTEVFTELPSELRKTYVPRERLLSGRGAPPAGCTLEGPSFDRAGNLYFVDATYGRIFRASPDGKIDVVTEYDGEPNGLRIHKDRQIYVADYKNGIVKVDPASGEVEPVVSRYRTEHFRGVNDLVFAPSGNLYFTDQGQTDLDNPTGAVYCWTAEGTLRRIIDNAPSPNGIAVTPDEKTIFVAVTRGNAIWRLPISLEGNVSRMGVFLHLSGGNGPDGVAMTEEGGLAVAIVGFGCVWIFDKLGEPLYRVMSCRGPLTTNIAFGGADRKTLFITENNSGAVLMARVPVAGAVLYSHM